MRLNIKWCRWAIFLPDHACVCVKLGVPPACPPHACAVRFNSRGPRGGSGGGQWRSRVNNLGQRLKTARLDVGLTLRELARQADVSPSLVSLIENGKSQPSVATLYAFARILDVSVDELFDQDSLATAGGAVAPPVGDADGAPAVMDPIHAWQPSEY